MANFDPTKYLSLRAQEATQTNPLDNVSLEKLGQLAQVSQQKQIELMERVVAHTQHNYVRDRDIGEALSDFGSQTAMGVGSAVQGIGEVIDIADALPELPGAAGILTGSVNKLRNSLKAALNPKQEEPEIAPILREVGGDARKFWHENLSEPRQKALQLKQERISEAEKTGGQFGGFTQGVVEAITDPEALFEQGANLALMAGLSRVGGSSMGIVGGGLLQGGDVASQTRESLGKLSEQQFKDNSPEYQELISKGVEPAVARQAVTDRLVQQAMGAGAAASVLVNRFTPGGNSIEKAMAGEVAKITTGKQLLKELVKGTAAEGFTEGIEEGTGQLFANERTQQINPEQELLSGVGAAAGMGVGMGIQMGGSINALSNTSEYAANKLDDALGDARKQEADRKAVAAAVEAGDPAPFMDRASSTYDPVKAIQVLHGSSVKPDATSDVRQTNLARATEALQSLDEDVGVLRERMQLATPEGIQELLAVPGISPERKAALEQLLQKRQETPVSKDAIKGVEQAFKEKEAAQKLAQDQVAQMHRDLGTAPTPAAEVTATLEQATAEVDPTDTTALASKQEAAKKVFTLAMAADSNLDSESLDTVIQDTTNGLSTEERGFLRKVSDARRLERDALTMDLVSQRVFQGEGRDIGIAQYRERVAQALASGDRALASSYLQKLGSFAMDHEAKANVAADAMRTNATIVRGRLPGSWTITERKLSDAELKGNLGLRMNSPKLAAAIQHEARAIRAAHTELNAAYDLRFSAAPVTPQSTQAAPAAPVTANSQSSRGVNQSNVDSTVNQPVQGEQATPAAPAQQTETPVSTETAAPSQAAAPAENQATTSTTESTEGAPTSPMQQLLERIKSMRDAANKAVGVVREITPQEQEVLDAAIGRFKEKVGDWALANVAGFVTFDPIEGVPTVGFVYEEDGKYYIAIKSSMFGEAGQVRSTVGEHNHLDGVLTHEVGHVIDEVYGGKDGYSGSKALLPGGSILTEVTTMLQSEKATDFLKKYFGYALKQTSDEQVASELFAQLYALYILSPEILNDALPRTVERLDQIFGRGIATSQAQTNGTTNDGGQLPSGGSTGSNDESTSEGDSNESGIVDTAEATEEVADPNVPEGTLEIMRQEPSKDTFLTKVAAQRKLLATFFKQRLGREGDTTQRPLVAVKDFLEKALSTPGFLWSFLPFSREESSQEQRAFLTKFGEFAYNWNLHWAVSMVAPKEAEFQYSWKDLPQELMILDGKGGFSLEQNVRTAMSFAVFSWIAEAGSTPLRKDRSEVASMLGLEDESELSDALYEQFRHMDMRSNRLASDLGKRFTEALGLAPKDGNTPADLMPRFQAAIGTHLILAMQKHGLLKEEELVDEGTIHRFAQLQRNTNVVQEIAAAAVGSKGILNQLFSVQERRPMPSLTVPSFNQATTVSGQEVPKTEQEILKAHNEQQNFLRSDTWNVVRLFSEGNMATLAGGKPFQEGKNHVDTEYGMSAKRDALLREIRDLKEFVQYSLMSATDQLATPFYLMHEVWKQQRVGILNRINPQMSKVHRHSMHRENGKAEIDMGNPEHMATFKLRVLEGLGVKTSHEANAKSLLRMQQLFDPSLSTEGLTTDELAKLAKLNAAVEVLMQLDTAEKLSEEAQQAVIAGVEVGGEAMLSLDALMAVAALRKAKKAGLTTFTSYLMGEIDGVTNGPILSHLMYGAAYTEEELAAFLEKGGIYTEESGVEHYNEWRAEPGRHDLYETMTAKAFEILASLTASAGKRTQLFETVKYFTGDLVDKDSGKVTSAGRNLSKEPIRPLIFGSGIGKAINNMADAFVDSILKTFEKMDESKVREAIDKLNYLIFEKGSNVSKIPENLTKQEFLKLSLSSEQRRLIAESFKNTFGEAFKQAIEAELGVFLERRKLITKASAAIFALYETTYNTLREQYVQELIAKGEIEGRQGEQGKIPTGDLTPKQERAFNERVRKLHPVVHTAMSKMDGNLRAGLPAFDSDIGLSEDPVYTTEVHIDGANVGQFREDKDGNKVPLKTRKVSAMWRRVSSPRVSLISMPIHAMDSAISHLANSLGLRYNMHDAQGTGVLDFTAMGQTMNKALWDVSLKYSPLMELFEVMDRTIRATQDVLASGKAPEGLQQALAQAIVDLANKASTKEEQVDPIGYLSSVFEELFSTAVSAETKKLGVMSKAVVFDQYASEGARYQVLSEDRAAALALKNKYAARTKPSNAATVAVTKLEEAVTSTIEKMVEESRKAIKFDAQTRDYYNPSVERLRLLIEGALHNLKAPKYVRTQLVSLLGRLNDGKSVKEALDQASKANQQHIFNVFDSYRASNPEHAARKAKEAPDRNDPALVEFFEAKTQRSVQETLEFLQSRMAEGAKGFAGFTRLLNARLLDWVVKNNFNINIRYVAPAMSAEVMLDNPNARGELSHGWYSAVNGKAEIYFLGNMYADSKLTPELVLHEILHAILSSTIEAGKSSLVKDLDGLLKQARDFVAGTAHAKTFEKALSNVHEFVSWGMTNEAFQEVVLKQLKVEEGAKKISAFRSFVKSVTEFLFGKDPKGLQTNGLMHFLEAVSRLLEKTTNEDQGANATYSMAAPTYHTTVDVFSALDQHNLTPGFADHLKGLLTGIVKAIYKDAGSYDDRVVYQPDPVAMWEAAKLGNAAPFASSVLLAPFNTDEATAFALEQVEATVMASLEDEHGQATFAYKELSRLYQEARSKLKPADFMDASGDAQLAQERWDFVFQAHQVDGKRSNYLARFAALGLAHPEVHAKLNFATSQKTETVADGKTVAEKVKIIFEKVLRFFATRATKTFDGQIADQKLATLVKQLIQLELNRREVLASKGALLTDRFGDFADKTFSGLRSKVGDIAQSDFFANNRFPLVQGLATGVTLVSKGRVLAAMKVVEQVRNRMIQQRHGTLMGILNDVKQAPRKFIQMLRSAKRNEQDRKFVITQVDRIVLESFVDKGKNLTKEAKAAITSVFLRTDMSSLLDTYGMERLSGFMTKQQVLEDEIRNIEHQLKGFPLYQHFYSAQAKTLAWEMVSGKVAGRNILFNAYSIARLHGTDQKGKISEADAQRAEPLIDALTSLYALSYTTMAERKLAAQVLAAEMARPAGENGVETVLMMHRQLQQDSRERLFQSSPNLMRKGYLTDIMNHRTEVVTATAAEGKELLEQGWIKVSDVKQDALDPDQLQKGLYMLKHAGLVPYQTGFFSLTSKQAKGSYARPKGAPAVHSRIRARQMEARARNDARTLFQANPGFDPRKVTSNFAAPLFNEQGDVVDFRYMMSGHVKDSLLERNSNFDEILGMTAGSSMDKLVSPQQNREGVLALKALYDADYVGNTRAYVFIGKNSTDPELREIYRTLPHETREAIREIWGADGMQVRVDVLDISFGYRERSLSKIFDKSRFTMPEAAFVKTVEGLLKTYALMANVHRVSKGKTPYDVSTFHKRAPVVVRQVEEAWQELAHEIKDAIVIKTGTVLGWNMVSNLSLLFINGVPLTDMVRLHREAIDGYRRYQKDNEELYEMQTRLHTKVYGTMSRQEIEYRVMALEDSIDRNPVKVLIDAGLKPTIVEDVESERDNYSYKSLLAKKAEKYTSKLNKQVVDMGKVVLMTHDTTLYQSLHTLTQMSDFVARYTLYQHLITKRKPLSKEDAIEKVADSFVNYDIPLTRNLQYLDKMGIAMFVKYFLRIQKVIFELMKDHPTRAIGMVLANQLFDVASVITDSSILARVDNLTGFIHGGALEYPTTFDDLATVNLGLSVFR